MEPVSLIIILKSFAMILALTAGIVQSYYGFYLYKNGVGSRRDEAVFKVGPVKLKARSVGSIVIATSFLWAYAGVKLSPNFKKKGDDIRIYSFKGEGGFLTTTTFAANVPKSDSGLLAVLFQKGQARQGIGSPEELKKLFEVAIEKSVKKPDKSYVELNGELATFDLESTEALKAGTDEYLLAARVKTNNYSAAITFRSELKGGTILFVPIGTSKIEVRKLNKSG